MGELHFRSDDRGRAIGWKQMIELQRLLKLGCGSKAKVGIGVSRAACQETNQRLAGLGCHVPLVPFDDPRLLVTSLRNGKIDAAVRGTMSSSEVLRELKTSFGISEVMRAAVLEGIEGRPFILIPVGIDEGIDFESRLRLARQTISYFGRAGWKLDVGILSMGRKEDVERGTKISDSIEEGERLARTLIGEGHHASHFEILVEDAVRGCSLVVAPDGVTGNLMFRTLHFIGGRNAYGAPVVNVPKVFVDTSRAKADFTDSVMLAAGLHAVQARGSQG